MRIHDRDRYVYTITHALGDDAELLELLKHTIKTLVVLVAIGQLQLDERLGNAPATLGVAHWDRGDLRAKLARLVVLLAQRE